MWSAHSHAQTLRHTDGARQQEPQTARQASGIHGPCPCPVRLSDDPGGDYGLQIHRDRPARSGGEMVRRGEGAGAAVVRTAHGARVRGADMTPQERRTYARRAATDTPGKTSATTLI